MEKLQVNGEVVGVEIPESTATSVGLVARLGKVAERTLKGWALKSEMLNDAYKSAAENFLKLGHGAAPVMGKGVESALKEGEIITSFHVSRAALDNQEIPVENLQNGFSVSAEWYWDPDKSNYEDKDGSHSVEEGLENGQLVRSDNGEIVPIDKSVTLFPFVSSFGDTALLDKSTSTPNYPSAAVLAATNVGLEDSENVSLEKTQMMIWDAAREEFGDIRIIRTFPKKVIFDYFPMWDENSQKYTWKDDNLYKASFSYDKESDTIKFGEKKKLTANNAIEELEGTGREGWREIAKIRSSYHALGVSKNEWPDLITNTMKIKEVNDVMDKLTMPENPEELKVLLESAKAEGTKEAENRASLDERITAAKAEAITEFKEGDEFKGLLADERKAGIEGYAQSLSQFEELNSVHPYSDEEKEGIMAQLMKGELDFDKEKLSRENVALTAKIKELEGNKNTAENESGLGGDGDEKKKVETDIEF